MGCCASNSQKPPPEKGQNRGCTDVFWLLLYIAFWSLMILIAAFSFVYGNPLRLVNGFDSFGNTCGTSNKRVSSMDLSGRDMSDRRYLLFYDIKELRNSIKVCVKQCPTRTLQTIDELDYYQRQTQNGLCNYNFDYGELSNPTNKHKSSLAGPFGPCPELPVFESLSVLNRCVPKMLGDVSKGLATEVYNLLNSWDTLEQILGDLYKSWKIILGLVFLSLLLSLFTISILHLLAHLVSYIIMILVSVASIGGTGFLWYTYYDLMHNGKPPQHLAFLSETVKNETAFFWYSIVATVITIVILLLVIVMRKQVGFLADLFKETSKSLFHIPGLFLQPLITFVFLLLFFTFWVTVVLCLATSYYPTTNSTSANNNRSYLSKDESQVLNYMNEKGKISLSEIQIVDYVDATWVKYMWWVYFIGLIWTSEFIMACQQMVISGAVAHWYYRDRYNGESHVTYAICKLIKYHLGSVALGSLIITALKIPRLILTYLHAKLSANRDKGSECAKCSLKCCICCFYCLEKCIRYLNHNAYTVIAIDGTNFCVSAATAFEVLTSHALQVATINGVGDFILFLGKCFVTALTGIIGLYLFRRDETLTFYAAPTLLVCVFAFFVAHCILSLYEMVLDTVYLCMCQNDDVPDNIRLQHLQQSATRNNGTPAHVEDQQQQIEVTPAVQ